MVPSTMQNRHKAVQGAYFQPELFIVKGLNADFRSYATYRIVPSRRTGLLDPAQVVYKRLQRIAVEGLP